MMKLRAPTEGELAEASALCLRSKAHWGYDDDFMRKCREELTLTPDDLSRDPVVVARSGGDMVGVAQISVGERCYLEKLFVDPKAMGGGVGVRCDGRPLDPGTAKPDDAFVVGSRRGKEALAAQISFY